MVTKGKIASVLCSNFGSSSKGLVSAWVTKNQRPDLLMTANGRNSSHTVVDSTVSNTPQVFKVLPAGAFYNGVKGYRPLIYIGPGAAFKVSDLLKEMGMTDMQASQIMIHPNASIVTDQDVGYENGTMAWDGSALPAPDHKSGTTAHGTTGSGSGAARARKALRKGAIARDYDELSNMISDPFPVIDLIQNGASALMDGSQGYGLGLYTDFYPNTTSRSCTLASFLCDCDMPVSLAGDVCAVSRTMPIRIHSKRYFYDGEPITYEQSKGLAGVEVVDSYSGGWYPDQTEYTWEQVSEMAGHHVEPEITTLTKNPRRIASFSHIGFKQFLMHNTPPTGRVHLFLTFLNYLREDHQKAFTKRMSDAHPSLESVHVSDSPETDSVVGCW